MCFSSASVCVASTFEKRRNIVYGLPPPKTAITMCSVSHNVVYQQRSLSQSSFHSSNVEEDNESLFFRLLSNR